MLTSITRIEKFSGPSKNCHRNVTDLTGSLVTSSRLPGRLQKRHNDRTSNTGVTVQTAGGSRWTTDAANEQCLKCECSSPSCTVVLWILIVNCLSVIYRMNVVFVHQRSFGELYSHCLPPAWHTFAFSRSQNKSPMSAVYMTLLACAAESCPVAQYKAPLLW